MADSADSPSDARIVTFLMGDIAGSSANWLAAPDTMDRALRAHDDVVARAVAAAGGDVFKHTGDGFIARFDEAGAAVDAARAIRVGLDEVDDELAGFLRVRLAIDTGWATPRGGDWFGPAVNRVARLTDLASHDGVILTRAANETALGTIEATSIGSFTLRSHVEPVAVLGVDGAAVVGHAASSSRFPTQLTSFLGRRAEQDAVADLLRGSRLVTIVAIGGAGKTRLAASVGEAAAADAGFVDLVPSRTAADVARALAAGVGIDEARLSSAADAAAILDHLVSSIGDGDRLVVLDNCEHVIDAVRAAAQTLLERCPGIRFLATSREALGIAGERVFPLPMLDVGAELFVARAADHGIVLDDDPAVRDAVSALCTALDGLPLAIEIAAARLREVGLGELVSDVGAIAREVDDGPPGAAARHRTMRQMVEWSSRDLDEPTGDLFERCALFEGTFRARDVELLGAEGSGELRTLVRRSLVTQDRQGLDVTYRMLEPVRQVALAMLHERGAGLDARRALARGLIGSAPEVYGARWWSWEWLEDVRPLLPTAWSVADALVESGDDATALRLVHCIAGAAIAYTGSTRVVDLFAARTDAIARLPIAEQAEVLVSYALAGTGAMQIDHTTAAVVALYGLELADSPALVYAHRAAALGAMNQAFGDGENLSFALDMVETARVAARECGSGFERAAVEAFGGWAHLLCGDWSAAEAASRTGMGYVAADNLWHFILAANLGMALVRQGRHDEALEVARTHPDLGREHYMGDMLGYVEVLALAGRGDHEEAHAAFGRAVDRVLASTHPGHRSDLALVAAWAAVHDGRIADAASIVDFPYATRGPHTLQLGLGLAERIGREPQIRRGDTTVEAALEPLLRRERDRRPAADI